MSNPWVVIWIMLGLGRAATAGPTCTAEAKATARQTATDKVNEARFAKALAAKKYKPLSLQRIALGEPQRFAPADVKRDQATTTTRNGATLTAITNIEGSCGNAHVEFAQQGASIVRIERKPTSGAATTVIVCGCPSPHFTCGGAAVTAQVVGYVLPKGTTFGGVVEIAYTADSLAITPEHECPMVAPPP